jgi:hypothetical protein
MNIPQGRGRLSWRPLSFAILLELSGPILDQPMLSARKTRR